MLFICDRAMEVWEELGLREYTESVVVQERSGATILEELVCSELPAGMGIPIVMEFRLSWWHDGTSIGIVAKSPMR